MELIHLLQRLLGYGLATAVNCSYISAACCSCVGLLLIKATSCKQSEIRKLWEGARNTPCLYSALKIQSSLHFCAEKKRPLDEGNAGENCVEFLKNISLMGVTQNMLLSKTTGKSSLLHHSNIWEHSLGRKEKGRRKRLWANTAGAGAKRAGSLHSISLSARETANAGIESCVHEVPEEYTSSFTHCGSNYWLLKAISTLLTWKGALINKAELDCRSDMGL